MRRQIQVTNTLHTNGIGIYIEGFAKFHSLPTVKDPVQRLLTDIAQRRMKKTGSYSSVCFYYCGNPGRVAFFVRKRIQPVKGRVIVKYFSNLIRVFGNKTIPESFGILFDEAIYYRMKGRQFFLWNKDFLLFGQVPKDFTVERMTGYVGR